MERAIIHSGLSRDSIQPPEMLARYFELLSSDVAELILNRPLVDVGCPVSGELSRRETFEKLGLRFNKSQKYGNVYISPRPTSEDLRAFYFESRARAFWLNEVWNETRDQRISKVIVPQLEWIRDGLAEHCSQKMFSIAEFGANHLGYALSASAIFPESCYSLVEPLIPKTMLHEGFAGEIWVDQLTPASQDAVLLFETLDRAYDPKKTIYEAKAALKDGGLCFLTCLLSTGFEAQVLGEESDIFIPPERMNIFSYEGLLALVEGAGDFEIIESSTPSVLDVQNVIVKLKESDKFLHYILKERSDEELLRTFQDFLQLNRLGTFGRMVLKKSPKI